ncbi:MAG: hypothetical protein KBA91_01210 [Candidatus Moranbacteria bacterium]|jgi:hypothetical protein|nr:hypothetical protein [Candidatus Moranbacteria bacterium]
MLHIFSSPICRSSFFLLSALFLFLIASPLAHAQTDDGLRLITSPLPISLSGEPGTSISTDLKVKNGGLGTETLKVSIMKFRAYEDSGKPQLMEREDGDDYFDWVHFSEPTFTLAPNEWKTVTATFDIPKEAAFGYYYAFVFSRAVDESPVGEKQTAIVGGTAVLVLFEAVVPNAKRQVEVAEFSLDHTFYEFLPTVFTVRLKNTGNVHIAPRGNIFIDRGSQKDITILEINREKGNILPQSNRDFETMWNDGFPVYENDIQDGKVVLDDNGHQKKTLTWDWNNASKLRFGKYTAKMLLIYDDGQRDIPIEGEVSFWVIPWRLIGGGVFILLFTFVGIRSTFKNIWRSIRKKDTVVS